MSSVCSRCARANARRNPPRRRPSARAGFRSAGPLFSQDAGRSLPLYPLRPVRRPAVEKTIDLAAARGRPARALRLPLLRRGDIRPGGPAERLQHRPDLRVDNLVGGPQLLYRARRKPVAAREPLERVVRLGRSAGPQAGFTRQPGTRRVLSRGTRHLASRGALPRVRVVRERLLGVLRAAQHRLLRVGLLPNHAVRYGLLRKGNVAAPGRGILRILRPARQVRAHGGKGEDPWHLPELRRMRAGPVRELLRVLPTRRSRRARVEPASLRGRSQASANSIAGGCRFRDRGSGRRDFRWVARDPALAGDSSSYPRRSDAWRDAATAAVLRYLPRLRGA